MVVRRGRIVLRRRPGRRNAWARFDERSSGGAQAGTPPKGHGGISRHAVGQTCRVAVRGDLDRSESRRLSDLPSGGPAGLSRARRLYSTLDRRGFAALGDAKEAAGMFEGVSQAVPDSNLLNQVALRAGEAWYQASSCPNAVSWFVKAVNGNDKDRRSLRSGCGWRLVIFERIN